jgi:plastocyanin
MERAVATSSIPTAVRDGTRPLVTHQRSFGGTLFRWALAGGLTVCLLGFVGFGLLALADYDMAGNGSPNARARLAWVWARGDHLHFAVHITQARLLDLCPCTRRAAGTQYYRAHFHAVTPHQRALAADSNPHTVADWAEYIAGPVVVVGDWVHDAATWLAGQRPTQQATVFMEEFEFAPDEIDVTRGTTVTWRNIDENGDAHTVTLDPGQAVGFSSDWVLPDESFSYTFTERGRYVYFDKTYGAPGQAGMSGVVVVS